MRQRRFLTLLTLGVLSAVAAWPAAANAPAADPALVEQGRARYTSSCARCHGIGMVTNGSIGADLRQFPAQDKERFVRSVSKGLRAMPAWEGILKPEEIEALWVYMLSVQAAQQ